MSSPHPLNVQIPDDSMICTRSRRLRTLLMLKKLLNSQDRHVTVLSFTPRGRYFSFDHTLLEMVSLDQVADRTDIQRIDTPAAIEESYDTDIMVLDTPSNIEAFRKSDSPRGTRMRERLEALMDDHDYLILDREQLPRAISGQVTNISEAQLEDGQLMFTTLRGTPPLLQDGEQASISRFIRA